MFSPKFRMCMVKSPFSQGYFPREKMFQHFIKWKIEDVREKRGLPFDAEKREKHLGKIIILVQNIIRGAMQRLNFGVLGFPALAMDLDDIYNDISFYIASTVIPRYNIKMKRVRNKNDFFQFIQNGIVFRVLFFRKKSKRRADKFSTTQLMDANNNEIHIDKYARPCDRLEMVNASQSIMSTFVRFRSNFTMTEKRVIDYILNHDDMMILHSSRGRDFVTRFRVTPQFKHLFMKKLGGLIGKTL